MQPTSFGFEPPPDLLERNEVAALFVNSRGPYPRLLSPRMCWDESRDARTYNGRAPVIAHPPCYLWGPMANVNYARYGSEDLRPGNDGGLFAFALDSVRRWGGVLEHPAFTRAWPAYCIAPPPSGHLGWFRIWPNEWVCEVWQSVYGHLCRKRTWLLYVGRRAPPELRWGRAPGTHQIGWYKGSRKQGISGAAASATPIPFAEDLIRVACCAA